MKRLCNLAVTVVLLVMLEATAHAVPADSEIIQATQPDGSQLSLRIMGDEFQGWYELAGNGHTILPNPSSGYWEYAEQLPDGKLTASGIRVLPGVEGPPAHIPKGIKPLRDTGREQHMNDMLKEAYQDRLRISPPADPTVPLAPGEWTPVPVSGTRNVLIILINFADRSLITSATGWYNKIFSLTDKSVARFYKDNSFNNLTVNPINHSQSSNPVGIVTVTVSDNHPNSAANFNYSVESTIINHALAQAASHVNFASYDTNSNGVIELSELNIYFIYAGYEASGSYLTPSIWAHAWGGTGVSVAGKAVYSWALNGELNNSSLQHPMGVIAHELGHSMCGLPDLYDTSGQNQAMGAFSLMAAGSWGADSSAGETYGGLTPVSLDAWSREYLGWTAPVEPTSPNTLLFDPALAQSAAAYRLIKRPVSSTEYFLIESRQAESWDLGLRRTLGSSWAGGLLITHIDITAGTPGSNDINNYLANSGRQGVVPEQASTALCNMLSVGATCRGNATTLFYLGNNSSWTPTSTPNSNYYNGAASFFSLGNISGPGSSMTASFTAGTANTITVTSPHAGEILTKGTVVPITWTYTGNPGANVRIQLYNGSTLSLTIASSAPLSAGSYSWTIPSTQAVGSNYTVKITSTTDSGISDNTDGPFTITGPTVTVLSPNRGEIYSSGTVIPITWKYTGNPGANVKIQLYNGSTLSRSITLSTPLSAGSYKWAIPSTQVAGSNYKIKITSTSYSTIYDSSDGPFSIITPTIAVVSPNGGEKLTRGSVVPITWGYTGNPGANVKIQLYNGIFLSRTITSSAPLSAGSYNWIIPATQPIGSSYKIKVISTTNAKAFDSSNASFSIGN